jgi:hypothetical protein
LALFSFISSLAIFPDQIGTVGVRSSGERGTDSIGKSATAVFLGRPSREFQHFIQLGLQRL